MKYSADLHIHSRFSRATSRNLDLRTLARGAMIKGLNIIGTGDFTHPQWFRELKECLVPAENGLYRLNDEFEREVRADVPESCRNSIVRFVLSAEISNIYKSLGKTRKVHNCIVMPSLKSAARLTDSLVAKGANTTSDGRPILGMDSRTLLELSLEADSDVLFFPAHIWTPHFSVLGAFSGFSTIEECYGDLSDHIFAIETGLSSDPPMNWRLASLDQYTLISNSDAHSAEKLGRECNLFQGEMNYHAMVDSIRTRKGFLGTVEFFPEEGKYHMDGHSPCKIRMTPDDTRAHQGRCPGCGKKITVGVSHRVADLADRGEINPLTTPEHRQPFTSLIPLREVIAQILGCGPSTKKVAAIYDRLISGLGPELPLLMHSPLDEIGKLSSGEIAQAIERMRCRQVRVLSGYDGEYGTIDVTGNHA